MLNLIQDLQKEIETTQAEFSDLERDQAKMTALVDGHAALVERLSESKTDLQGLLEARQQLAAARELVNEQKAAINEAKTRLETLANSLARETAHQALLETLTPLAARTSQAYMTWQALLVGLNETTQKLLKQFVNSRNAYITLQTELGQVLTEHGVSFDNVSADLTAQGINVRALTQPLPFHGTPLNPRVGWGCTVKLDEASGALLEQILNAIKIDIETQEHASRAKPKPLPSEVDLSLTEFAIMVGDVELRQGDIVYHGENRMPFVALTRVRKLNDPVGYLRVAPLENFAPHARNDFLARCDTAKDYQGVTELLKIVGISGIDTNNEVAVSVRKQPPVGGSF